jgi:hypothetical protein
VQHIIQEKHGFAYSSILRNSQSVKNKILYPGRHDSAMREEELWMISALLARLTHCNVPNRWLLMSGTPAELRHYARQHCLSTGVHPQHPHVHAFRIRKVVHLPCNQQHRLHLCLGAAVLFRLPGRPRLPILQHRVPPHPHPPSIPFLPLEVRSPWILMTHPNLPPANMNPANVFFPLSFTNNTHH